MLPGVVRGGECARNVVLPRQALLIARAPEQTQKRAAGDARARKKSRHALFAIRRETIELRQTQVSKPHPERLSCRPSHYNIPLREADTGRTLRQKFPRLCLVEREVSPGGEEQSDKDRHSRGSPWPNRPVRPPCDEPARPREIRKKSLHRRWLPNGEAWQERRAENRAAPDLPEQVGGLR